MEVILQYKNKKTNSFINYIANCQDDFETFNYLSKMMLWNDNRLLKNNMQRLANVLTIIPKEK